MKKYLYSAAAILVSTLALTSCLGSSSDDQRMTYNYGGTDCFNRVTDLQTGDEFIGSGPNYEFQYNTSAGTVDITLSNLILTSGQSPLSLKLPTLSYSQDATDGFIVTTGRSLTPMNTGSSSYIFDSFTLRAYPGRQLGSVFNVRYTLDINGQPRYSVVTYANRNVYLGPTSATNLDPSATTPTYSNAENLNSQAEAYYVVILNMEKKTATLQVYNGKFAENMSPLTFMAKDIPMNLTYAGYTAATDLDQELGVYTGTSGDQPAEGLTMSNVSIVADLERGATIRFTCDLGDSGKYNVTASLRYLLYQNTSSDSSN